MIHTLLIAYLGIIYWNWRWHLQVSRCHHVVYQNEFIWETIWFYGKNRSSKCMKIIQWQDFLCLLTSCFKEDWIKCIECTSAIAWYWWCSDVSAHVSLQESNCIKYRMITCQCVIVNLSLSRNWKIRIKGSDGQRKVNGTSMLFYYWIISERWEKNHSTWNRVYIPYMDSFLKVVVICILQIVNNFDFSIGRT